MFFVQTSSYQQSGRDSDYDIQSQATLIPGISLTSYKLLDKAI